MLDVGLPQPVLVLDRIESTRRPGGQFSRPDEVGSAEGPGVVGHIRNSPLRARPAKARGRSSRPGPWPASASGVRLLLQAIAAG